MVLKNISSLFSLAYPNICSGYGGCASYNSTPNYLRPLHLLTGIATLLKGSLPLFTFSFHALIIISRVFPAEGIWRILPVAKKFAHPTQPEKICQITPLCIRYYCYYYYFYYYYQDFVQAISAIGQR